MFDPGRDGRKDGRKDRRNDVRIAKWASREPLLVVLLAAIAFVILSLPAASAASIGGRAPVNKEIVDPCLGVHWRWVANAAHASQPGRLVMVEAASRAGGAPRGGGSRESSSTGAMPHPPRSVAKPVLTEPVLTEPVLAEPVLAIRIGDRIEVDQSSPQLYARFQAVALQSAIAGHPLRVRLLVSKTPQLNAEGAVIVVTASGPGQASWTSSEGSSR